jgi:ribosomal protein S18 acetylase RimI-like enzyme
MSEIPIPGGIGLRPQRDSDAPFVAALYDTTRDDLRHAIAPPELIEELIEMQFRAQREGYGQKFPNAMYFIVEAQGERIGRVAVDFGPNEVRIIDLALIPAARNKGHGTSVFRALQAAAGKVRAPLTLTVAANNPRAAQLYAALGFRVEQQTPTHAFMVWYPQGG